MFSTAKGLKSEAARLKGAATTIRSVAGNQRLWGLDDKKCKVLLEAATILGSLGVARGREAKVLRQEEKSRALFIERAEREAREAIAAWPANTVAEQIALIGMEGWVGQRVLEMLDGPRVNGEVSHFLDERVRDAREYYAGRAASMAWEKKAPVTEILAQALQEFNKRLANPSARAAEILRRFGG